MNFSWSLAKFVKTLFWFMTMVDNIWKKQSNGVSNDEDCFLQVDFLENPNRFPGLNVPREMTKGKVYIRAKWPIRRAQISGFCSICSIFVCYFPLWCKSMGGFPSSFKFVGAHLCIHLYVHEPFRSIYTWHMHSTSGPQARCLPLVSIALIKRQGVFLLPLDEMLVHRRWEAL